VASLFVLDIEDYAPISECAIRDNDVEVRRVGPYVELRFGGTLTVDRVSTGLRHALWYSGVAALNGARVVQYDKTRLRLQADE
jgi:hypothetical protein